MSTSVGLYWIIMFKVTIVSALNVNDRLETYQHTSEVLPNAHGHTSVSKNKYSAKNSPADNASLLFSRR